MSNRLLLFRADRKRHLLRKRGLQWRHRNHTADQPMQHFTRYLPDRILLQRIPNAMPTGRTDPGLLRATERWVHL
jgi:hypothetical protein